MVTLLLTLKRFYTLFWYFHYWPWTRKNRLELTLFNTWCPLKGQTYLNKSPTSSCRFVWPFYGHLVSKRQTSLFCKNSSPETLKKLVVFICCVITHLWFFLRFIVRFLDTPDYRQLYDDKDFWVVSSSEEPKENLGEISEKKALTEDETC